MTETRQTFTHTPLRDQVSVTMPAFDESPEPKAQAAHDLSAMPATELPELVMKTDEIRNGANGHTNGHTNGHSTDPFKLSQEFAYTPRRIKVITIGAGFSGLLMAHKFQHRFPEMEDIVDHTIFEARSDIGGTWLANNYPGVQCDVPAHIYVCWPQIHSVVLDLITCRHFLSTPTPTGRGSMPVEVISCLT